MPWDQYKEELAKELSYDTSGPSPLWTKLSRCATALSSPTMSDMARIDPSARIPNSPWEPSEAREGGTAMWDLVLTQGLSKAGHDVRRPQPLRQLKPTRHTNADSIAAMYQQMHVGHPQWAVITPAVTGPELWVNALEAAHAFTHLKADKVYKKSDWWGQYMTSSRAFLDNFAGLIVARHLGLTVQVPTIATPMVSVGVRVCTTLRTDFVSGRQPVLQWPWDRRMPVDWPSVFVSAAVTVGSDPRVVREGFGLDTADWWSYLPTAIYIMGWETPGRLLHSSLYRQEHMDCAPDSSPAWFSMHGQDLQPAVTLPQLLKGAPPPPEGAMTVEELVSSSHTLNSISYTRPFPCQNCVAMSGAHLRPLFPGSAASSDPGVRNEAQDHKIKLQAGLKAIRQVRRNAGEDPDDRRSRQDRWERQYKMVKPRFKPGSKRP